MIVIKKDKKGFLVLTMVLIVSAVVLSVATGMFLRSLSEMTESGDSEMALKAWASVNACGEYALGQLASTTDTPGWSYGGDETLNIPLADGDKTCYIYAVAPSGSGKLIKASSTVSNFTKKIQIIVATNTPSVLVSSWVEVADF